VRIVGSLKKLHGGKLEGKDGRRGGLPNYPDPELMNWSSELFRVTSI
jgi:hypothetical protein